MARYGVLTSGGDAPGMNAAIRAVVRTATAQDHSVVGFTDGYRGCVSGSHVELDHRAVGNIVQRGGTVIGTSRCPAFMEPEGRAEAARHIREAGVDGLVVIGGDGSFRGASVLEHETGIPCVGVPGTIDNDIYGTEETIGFDTAVNTAVHAVDQIRDTSESTGMLFYVEVMGRHSGAIAMHTALAAGAIGVFVPESRDEMHPLVDRLKESFERGKRSHIIIVAEGDQAGGAFEVAESAAAHFPHEYRVVILGHTQRGGAPSARDRVVAAQTGSQAVKALMEGRSGIAVGVIGGRVVETPFCGGRSESGLPARVCCAPPRPGTGRVTRTAGGAERMAITLEVGDAAPAFELPDQDGNAHSLEKYAGKTVVLYFYPKDETPGCTKQACSFRDNYQAILDEGAVVLGLSPDSAESHKAFIKNHSLPLPLLVDEGAEVATRYGSWGEKTLYGRTSIGMTRSTFIIGPDGKISRLWKRAKAADHGDVVLKALRKLAGKDSA